MSVAAASVGVFLVWSAIPWRHPRAMYARTLALVLAELLPDKGSGHLVLGYYPWLESLFALDRRAGSRTSSSEGGAVHRVRPRGRDDRLTWAEPSRQGPASWWRWRWSPRRRYHLPAGRLNQRLPAPYAVLLGVFLVTTLPRAPHGGRASGLGGSARAHLAGHSGRSADRSWCGVPFLAAVVLGRGLGLLDREVALSPVEPASPASSAPPASSASPSTSRSPTSHRAGGLRRRPRPCRTGGC
jgi:hypothetical protein